MSGIQAHTIHNEGQDISEQFQNGKITIDLNGQKLKGRFSLIKTSRENQWLLIKANDEFASEDEDLTTSKPDSVLMEGTNQVLHSRVKKPRRKGKNLNGVAAEKEHNRRISNFNQTNVS